MNKLMQTGKWGCQAGIWKYETRGSGERFKLEIKNQEEKRRASQWLEAGEMKNIQEKKCLRENGSRGRGECDSLVPQWRKCSRKDRVVKVLSAAPKSSLMGPLLDLGPRGYWRPQRREFQKRKGGKLLRGWRKNQRKESKTVNVDISLGKTHSMER